jgi:hypothetical protein
MARIRTVKPEIWMSPQVMNLSHGARLLFLGLITQADDAGRGVADARKLKAAIFGGDDITSTDVRRWLDELASQRLANLYEDASHGNLYELPSWKAHQSIDRPRESSYPSSKQAANPDVARRTLDESRTSPREGSDRTGPEWKGREGNVPPRAREPELSSPKTGGERRQQTAGAWSDAELMDAFAVVKSTYPKRTGDQSVWLLGERAWRERLDEGVPAAELLAGVERFAAFVTAGGVSGPHAVMGPQKFFDRHAQNWAQPWDPPPTKADKRLANNLNAAEEFLRRTETGA